MLDVAKGLTIEAKVQVLDGTVWFGFSALLVYVTG